MSTRLIALFFLITLVAQVTGLAPAPNSPATAEESPSTPNSEKSSEIRAAELENGIVEFCKERPDICASKRQLPPPPPPP